MNKTKEFYTLEELASEFSCIEDKLLRLAANGELQIFIAANNWYGHIWKKPFNDDGLSPYDSMEDFNLGDATLETPLEKPISLNNSLVQLKKSSIAAHLFNKNKTTNVGAFEARDMINGPEEFIFELRLCSPNDYSKPFEINLNDYKLVVKNYNSEKIKNSIASAEVEEAPIKDSERTKLLKHIGLLAMLLSSAKKNFEYSKKPNSSQIYTEIENLLDNYENKGVYFNKHGAGKSSLSETIKEGIEKLIEK